MADESLGAPKLLGDAADQFGTYWIVAGHHMREQIADQGLPSWSHTVVSGGRLYIRNQATLTVYDLRAR